MINQHKYYIIVDGDRHEGPMSYDEIIVALLTYRSGVARRSCRLGAGSVDSRLCRLFRSAAARICFPARKPHQSAGRHPALWLQPHLRYSRCYARMVVCRQPSGAKDALHLSGVCHHSDYLLLHPHRHSSDNLFFESFAGILPWRI